MISGQWAIGNSQSAVGSGFSQILKIITAYNDSLNRKRKGTAICRFQPSRIIRAAFIPIISKSAEIVVMPSNSISFTGVSLYAMMPTCFPRLEPRITQFPDQQEEVVIDRADETDPFTTCRSRAFRTISKRNSYSRQKRQNPSSISTG